MEEQYKQMLEKVLYHFRMNLSPNTSESDAEIMVEIDDLLTNKDK